MFLFPPHTRKKFNASDCATAVCKETVARMPKHRVSTSHLSWQNPAAVLLSIPTPPRRREEDITCYPRLIHNTLSQNKFNSFSAFSTRFFQAFSTALMWVIVLE
jgi:hypothetical protein